MRQNHDICRPGALSCPDPLEKPTKLRGDLLCLAEHGEDPHAVLQDSGVTLEDIWAQTPLPCGTIAALFDRLAGAAPRHFGVTCGRSIRLHYLGLLGVRLSNCSTIGELFLDWTRYSVIIGYPLHSALTTESDRWKMTFRPRYPLSDAALVFCAESTIAGFTQSLFNMTGRRIILDEAAFAFPRPADPSVYDGIDAQRISFGAPIAFVTGSAADLALPITTADATARAISEAYCRESLSLRHADETFAERLSAVIRELGLPIPDEQTVSLAMNVSIRTMQRNLAAERRTFHGIVDAIRLDRTVDLIRQGHANKTIAHALGYGDVTSFSRAFKRWTGMRPGGWRSATADRHR